MRLRIRAILEYGLALVVVVLLILAIAGVIVVKFHGEELESYVLEQVNERIDTRIDVEDIKVKVFHKFPHTSLVLENITVWSSHNFSSADFPGEPADTLMVAESLSLSFNLLRMIRKEFVLRQVEISNGSLQILTDKQGESNYKFLSEERKGNESSGSIDISQFNVNSFRIRVHNLSKELWAEGQLEQLDLDGKFSRKSTQIKGNLKARVGEISNKGVLYASDRSLALGMNLAVADSIFELKSGQIELDRILADVDGRILVHRGLGLELQLEAAARNLEIHEVLDLLPSELARPLRQIRGNGQMEVLARINGMASPTLTPSVEADFSTSKANLFWERLPFSLKKLELRGSYSNGGEFSPLTTSVNITSVSALIGKDPIRGSGHIRNFLDPVFSFELDGEVHPDQWLNWYEKIPLHEAAGSMTTDVRVSGAYNRRSPKGKRFAELDIEGQVALQELFLRIQPDGAAFSGLNGTLSIKNDFWEPAFSGRFGSSDFQIEGSGLNLLSFFTGKQTDLVASASFRAHYLDLQEILDQLPRDPSGERAAVHFPENLDLRLEFIIDDFVKEKLVASNLRGVAFYDSPFLHIDSLVMQGMEGSINGSFGMIQDREENIFTNVDARLYGLNIRTLFEAFNNFGQNQLTHEHLEGRISGSSVFSANFDPAFRIIPSSILSENDIRIVDGELNGFSPIMALSRFVDVEELQNIRFNTLENNILVKDEKVIIPAMDIQSNALNLAASGIHGFDNHYDYRLTLKLSQILYRKARNGKNKSEFEVADDLEDQRTLFLKVYDQGEGASVEVDREQTSQKIKKDLKEEKLELKTLLNKELGLFKHDSQVDSTSRREENQQEKLFRFEFDDDAGRDSLGQQNNRSKRRWRMKKDTAKNKPAEEFVIDE